jgi:hypothetical protein
VIAWTGYWLVRTPQLYGYALSWHFFVGGARRMVGLHYRGYPLPGGLHLYANYPQLQISPLSLLVALPLALLPHDLSQAVAVVLMTAAGPVTIGLVADAARRRTVATPRRGDRRRGTAVVAVRSR